jgi:hypothetical protein
VLNALGAREPVVAVARAVTYGQTIREADLVQAMLPEDSGLAAVPWSQVGGVIGRTAAGRLVPGQLLVSDAVAVVQLPPPGQAVVGVAVKPGQVPATELGAQDRVLVIDGAEGAGVGVEAEVLRSGDADSSGSRTVDVLVDNVDAAEVARLSQAERAVIVLIEDR